MCFQLNGRSCIDNFLRVSDQILRVAPDSLRGSEHRLSVGASPAVSIRRVWHPL
jgi:hypothetical protein